MANSQPIWAKTQWEPAWTHVRRHTWKEYRNIREKQKTATCQVHLYQHCIGTRVSHITSLAMCACQVHPSIPASVGQASTQRQKTATHSQKSCQEEKSGENVETGRERMQRIEFYLPYFYKHLVFVYHFPAVELVSLNLCFRYRPMCCFLFKCQQSALGSVHSILF